ncbi:MAG TPA: hypothetical protein VFB31_03720 [Pseudolabrys sp.]|nr:hypothetical protein [Pseudolabrys sp.]
MSDLIAILSVVVAIAAGIYAAVMNWKISGAKDAISRIDNVESKLKSLHQHIAADTYVIDSIAGALHALTKRQTILYQLASLAITDDFYDREEIKELAAIQKRLTELGLFSQDLIRRISAQRSLAHSYGDFQSLKLMKKIEAGELGVRDKEILDQISILEKRLERMHEHNVIWAGRPGGGAF